MKPHLKNKAKKGMGLWLKWPSKNKLLSSNPSSSKNKNEIKKYILLWLHWAHPHQTPVLKSLIYSHLQSPLCHVKSHIHRFWRLGHGRLCFLAALLKYNSQTIQFTLLKYTFNVNHLHSRLSNILITLKKKFVPFISCPTLTPCPKQPQSNSLF